MHLYSGKVGIQNTIQFMGGADEFFDSRLNLYQKRKEYIERNLEKETNIWKQRFIQDLADNKIEIRNVKQKDLHKQFSELKYPKFDLSHVKGDVMYKPSYDYLNMRIWALTKEKVDELTELSKQKRWN